MPEAVSLVDPIAVQTVLRRMARAAGAPWLHAEVARRMAERLVVIRLQPDTLMQWWPFTGAGDAELAAAYPAARRVRVEPTTQLRQRSAEVSKAPWWAVLKSSPSVVVEADVAAGQARMVWANMMLHAAGDPERVMAQWHAALDVGGFVMFSTFGPDTLAGLRELYAQASWPAPTQAFVDMHDLGDQMVHAGFADPVMDMEHITLTWDDADKALAELRGLGGNVNADRFPGLRTPRWRTRLRDALQARRDADGRIALGFEIVYGHAFKPQPRLRVAEETRITPEALRSMARGPRP